MAFSKDSFLAGIKKKADAALQGAKNFGDDVKSGKALDKLKETSSNAFNAAANSAKELKSDIEDGTALNKLNEKKEALVKNAKDAYETSAKFMGSVKNEVKHTTEETLNTVNDLQQQALEKARSNEKIMSAFKSVVDTTSKAHDAYVAYKERFSQEEQNIIEANQKAHELWKESDIGKQILAEEARKKALEEAAKERERQEQRRIALQYTKYDEFTPGVGKYPVGDDNKLIINRDEYYKLAKGTVVNQGGVTKVIPFDEVDAIPLSNNEWQCFNSFLNDNKELINNTLSGYCNLQYVWVMMKIEKFLPYDYANFKQALKTDKQFCKRLKAFGYYTKHDWDLEKAAQPEVINVSVNTNLRQGYSDINVKLERNKR